MTDRALRLRLGLFVLLAFMLFGTLIVMFGSLPGLFRSTHTYTIRFPEAPGLTVGAPVRRSGVRIGTVSGITLDDERGIVRVRVAIDSQYTIRKSERPMLSAGLIAGDVSVDFVPRTDEPEQAADRGPVEPGTELVGTRAASVNTLLARATEVVPTTQETLNDIRKSMQSLEKLATRFDKMTPLVEETIREYRDLGKTARETIPELRKTNDEAREAIRTARQMAPSVERTADEVRELARSSREAIPQIRQSATEVGELAKSLRETMPELRKTNDEAREAIRTARQMAPTIERTADEFRELARTARETVPELRKTSDDIGTAARNWSRVGERTDKLLQENQEKLTKTIENVNDSTARINRLLSDDNIKSVQTIVGNLRIASEQAPSISKSAEDILTQGRTTVRQLNSTLKTADSTFTDVQKAVKPFSDRSGSILKNTDETVIKLNGALDDVRALFKAIDQADGTFRKFLTDPAIFNNIDQATAMITRLVPRIELILKDVEVFVDKLARHPESIGIGGVVRPGSGLKNPPIAPPPPQGIFHQR
jgi:phospholipid/cholesterol/gamma-HCH transport system substrate-binding protein